MKSRAGQEAEKRKIRREKSRRERVRRKKMQMREKVGKSRNTVFFQWFVAPEGRKVGLLKRRVRSQLARWEMKNCTPLWREAHFQVKMYKAPQLRTTFGSWDVEKVHAVVARSTCRSQNVEMSKKCTPLWREARFEVKMYRAHHCRTTFGSWDVEKVYAVVARSTCRSQNVKTPGVRTTFGRSDVIPRGTRGTFEEDLHRCIFRGRHSTKEIWLISGVWVAVNCWGHGNRCSSV